MGDVLIQHEDSQRPYPLWLDREIIFFLGGGHAWFCREMLLVPARVLWVRFTDYMGQCLAPLVLQGDVSYNGPTSVCTFD